MATILPRRPRPTLKNMAVELREEVFKHVLVVPGAIKITRKVDAAATQAAKAEWDRKRALGLIAAKPAAGKVYYFEAVYKSGPGNTNHHYQRKDLGIVSANKSMSKEALAVLFAHNTFVFGNQGVFKAFFTTIGGSVELLRSVGITSVGPLVRLPELRAATRLRSVTITSNFLGASVALAAWSVIDGVLNHLALRREDCVCVAREVYVCTMGVEREEIYRMVTWKIAQGRIMFPDGVFRGINTETDETAFKAVVLARWWTKILGQP